MAPTPPLDRPQSSRSRAATAWLAWTLGAVVAGLAGGAVAQLALRTDDPVGTAQRVARVRVIHSTEPTVPGTSMNLQQTDPWLAYLRGRAYFFHEWGQDDGAFRGLPPFGGLGGATTTSCGMCHNVPFPSGGAGGNGMVPVGYGRSTPHLFGAGLLEILAQQIRAEILAGHDTNGNGFLDVPTETAGQRALVRAVDGVTLDFGGLDDADGDGAPDLNPVISIFPKNAQGKLQWRGPGRPANLSDPEVVGYDFAVSLFGASASDHQFSTLRIFTLGVLMSVMGIPPDDPTTRFDLGERRDLAAGDGWAETSNAGAAQPHLPVFSAIPASFAPGVRIAEGEADLFEWFLLNHPRPAVGRQDDRTRRGQQLLAAVGCTRCHQPDWEIQPADPLRGLPGDRRFFDLAVSYDAAGDRLEGRLHSLTEERPGPGDQRLLVPRRGGFRVTGLYSDLRYHDLGPRYAEYPLHDGKLTSAPLRYFRTSPLWGVGSSPPYSHDGRDATLDDAIRRHGGEAEASRNAYLARPAADREALVAFLRTLVTYAPDTLPTDLDGDGVISPGMQRAGRELGPERFQAELLLRTPPHYLGWTTGPEGERYFSYRLLNAAEAYGETLEALRDANGDGLPDLLGAPPPPAPDSAANVGSGR